MATAQKTEYENQTQGYVGVVKINRKGDEIGEPVAPGERVFLTREEVEASEQSHKHAKDSPFAKREIIVRDPATLQKVDSFVGPALKRVTSRTRARTPVAA